jgi:hypothetical protein
MRTTISDPKNDPMREEEWLAWTDPREMAEFLEGAGDSRKLRQAGVAWVQSLPEYVDAHYGVRVGDYDLYLQRNLRFPFLAEELQGGYDKAVVLDCMGLLVKAVEVAELFADGRATPDELALAHRAAREVDVWVAGASYGDELLAWVALGVSQPSAIAACLAVREAHMRAMSQYDFTHGGGYAIRKDHITTKDLWHEDVVQEVQQDLRRGCDILRDVIGNPFRPKPTVDSSVCVWNNHAIEKVARAIYEERTFDPLPMLADALEEAGCRNDGVLTHCRSSERHWKGCWVVDLLLPEEFWCNG